MKVDHLKIVNFQSVSRVDIELAGRNILLLGKKFQFQSGTIRSDNPTCLKSSELYFNSSQVRLEVPVDKKQVYPDAEFQFQSGTIRRSK